MSDLKDSIGRHPAAGYRRAGSKWRILVHRMAPKGRTDFAHHIAHHRDFGYGYSGSYDACKARLGAAAEYGDVHEFPNTELDEVVIGRFFHLEQMDTGFYWASLGGVVFHVRADRDGNPKSVSVRMPGYWEDAVPGCEYFLNEEPYP